MITHRDLRNLLLLVFFFLFGWILFVITNLILGEVVDYEIPLLLIPLLYFIASGLCWCSAILLIHKPRVVHKKVIVEKKVKAEPVVVEKPVIIEKKVFIEAPKEKLGEEIKDYFIGSKETGKYHIHSCKWTRGIKPENRIYFKNKEKAGNTGYKKCKTCMKIPE